MNNIKIAVAVLVLSSGVVGSYFIIKNSVPKVDSAQKIAESENSIQNIIKDNPIKWLSEINSTSSANFNSPNFLSSDILKNTSKENNQDNSNLTQLVSQTLFNKMKSQDQAGSNPFNNNSSEGQKMAQDAINNIQNSQLLFDYNISDAEILISQDNSFQTKSDYLGKIYQITDNRLNNFISQNPGIKVNDAVEADCFGKGSNFNKNLSNVYGEIVNDSLAIQVPSDWKDLHKKIINHFKKSQSIHLALARCSADPIKGYLAIQELPKLTEETQFIQDELNSKLNEINNL